MDDDAEYVQNLPGKVLQQFRKEIFAAPYIEQHPHLFLDSDWALPYITQLKAFVDNTHSSRSVSSYSNHPTRTLVKAERPQSPSGVPIKIEDISGDISQAAPLVATRSTFNANGQEVLEILDSDEELDVGSPCVREGDGESDDDLVGMKDFGDASTLVPSDSEGYEDLTLMDDLSDFEDLSEDPTGLEAPTVWLDKGLSSTAQNESIKITRQCKVDRVETLSDLPSLWPVPYVPTAYVVDLNDPKYNFYDPSHNLLTPDHLIRNKDQDSWKGSTGRGDSTPFVHSVFGETPVRSYRVRLKCAGSHACENIDASLFPCERFELDRHDLDAVVNAQIQSRIEEASAGEHQSLIFFFIVQRERCSWVGKGGQPCLGHPVLRSHHSPFIGCSAFKAGEKHRSLKIPANVDVNDIAALLAGKKLPSAMQSCSRIIPAHIGAKVKKCGYPHSPDGTQSLMVPHPCPAERTIFVPVDEKLRMACVVPDHGVPHNHPILPATKTPLEISQLYRKCIEAVGVARATVKSVENAPTTKLILGGLTPTTFSPSLQSSRKKQDLVQEVKKEKFPGGMDTAGAYALQADDASKPLHDRYVHTVTTTKAGGILIFTFCPTLLALIHEVSSIQVDTTFKRIQGEVQEWEMTAWYVPLLQAVTLARVYTNKANRVQFYNLFAGLQELTMEITHKPISFARLNGGNLLTMGVDLEAAQVLGAGDAFLSTNDPKISGIHSNDPEVIVQYFVRACATHVTRGIRDLQSLVSHDDYVLLKSMTKIKTSVEWRKFSARVATLCDQSPKIKAWWNHKTMHKWMLPTIVPYLSKIFPKHLDITEASTNMNESQHKWTNDQTGTRHSLVGAIELAREADQRIADEIQARLASGSLRYTNNGTVNRMVRNLSRGAAADAKAKATREKQERSAAKSASSRKAPTEANSSGRAPKAKASKQARLAAQPYPTSQHAPNVLVSDPQVDLYAPLPGLDGLIPPLQLGTASFLPAAAATTIRDVQLPDPAFVQHIQAPMMPLQDMFGAHNHPMIPPVPQLPPPQQATSSQVTLDMLAPLGAEMFAPLPYDNEANDALDRFTNVYGAFGHE